MPNEIALNDWNRRDGCRMPQHMAEAFHALHLPAQLDHQGAERILNQCRRGFDAHAAQLGFDSARSGFTQNDTNTHQLNLTICRRRITKQPLISISVELRQLARLIKIHLNRCVLTFQPQLGDEVRLVRKMSLMEGQELCLRVIQRLPEFLFMNRLRQSFLQSNGAENACLFGHEDRLYPKLTGDRAGMLGTRTTEGEQSMIGGIISLGQGDAPDRIRHVLDRQAQQGLQQLLPAQAAIGLRVKLMQTAARCFSVQGDGRTCRVKPA